MRELSKDELIAEYDRTVASSSKKSSLTTYYIRTANVLCGIMAIFSLYYYCVQPIIDKIYNLPVQQKYNRVKQYASDHFRSGGSNLAVGSSSGISSSSTGGASSGIGSSSGVYGKYYNSIVELGLKIKAKTGEKLYTRDEVILAINFGFDSAGVKLGGVKKLTVGQQAEIKRRLATIFFEKVKK